jgi:uncharacterized 2Fe-2S/4Fe-4S cluster protein (DUF4445 family)
VSDVVVTVEPEGRKIRSTTGVTLLNAFAASGMSLRSECGGQGICGKCKVQLTGTPWLHEVTDQEKRVLTHEELALNLRLACQIRLEGDLTVLIPVESRVRQRRIQDAGVSVAFELAPAIRKLRAQPSPSTLLDPQPYAERLLRVLEATYDLRGLTMGYAALKKLPGALRASRQEVTATIWHGHEVIDVEAGDTAQQAYGLAVDIGTSKIVGQLVSLDDGHIVATSSLENPQILHGEDVISRITFASASEVGLDQLHAIVVDGINALVSQVCEDAGVSATHLYEMTIVGNSAMHHLLLHIPPLSLALAPYVPTVKRPLDLKPQDLPLQMNEGGNIHLPPLVAGFVGADNVAGLLATGVHKSPVLSLFIDIGTNTEVNLGNHEGLLCCSCASGPAFEGAHIRDGMKAVHGAIERVAIDATSDAVHFQVIGGGKPVGICGSAMIDLLAELFRHRLVDNTGRLNGDASTERMRKGTASLEFVVAWQEETDKAEDIVITQGDIRELQLAKAAIYTGCAILMQHRGVSPEAIERVYLAGAFGNYIDAVNAKIIGLIPDVPTEKVVFVGNSALAGARMTLLSTAMRREAADLSQRLTYVELGVASNFNEELIDATYLPHKDYHRFPFVHRLLGNTTRPA